MEQIQIRKVTFGGYHRGDVERVLSTMGQGAGREPSQQEEALRASETENAALRVELAHLREENDKLSQLIARKEEIIQGLREINAQMRKRLEELRQADERAADRHARIQKIQEQIQSLDNAIQQESSALEAFTEQRE